MEVLLSEGRGRGEYRGGGVAPGLPGLGAPGTRTLKGTGAGNNGAIFIPAARAAGSLASGPVWAGLRGRLPLSIHVTAQQTNGR